MTSLTLLVVLLCAAAALLVREVAREGRQQASIQLLDTSRALSLAVDGQLERYRGVLEALRQSDSLRRHDWAAFDARARALLAGPGAWIVLTDRNGRQLVNTRLAPGAPLPTRHGHLPFWTTLDQGRGRVCNLTQGQIFGRILCVDVPVMEQGRAPYALSVAFEPAELGRTIVPQRGRPDAFRTIIDRNGIVIWRNSGATTYVGQPATAILRRAMAAHSEDVVRSVSLDGVPGLVAYTRSPLSGWTFAATVPMSQLSATRRFIVTVGLGGTLLLLLLGGVVGVIASRRVQGAVSRLSDAVLRIGRGEPPQFRPSGLAEIDAVGGALDQAIAERDRERERFDLAQEVGGIGAWDWDALKDEGHVTETYKRMHGLGAIAGPLRLAQVRAVIHPDDLAGFDARLAAARARPGASTNEYRVVHADGRIGWVSAKGRPLFDAAGRQTGAIGIVRDITAERATEEALRASELRYRTLFETIAVGFCVVEPTFDEAGRAIDARILEANPAFERIAGAAPAPDPASLAARLGADWAQSCGDVLLTGEPARFERELMGAGRWFDVQALRVGEAGRHRVALLLDDVTERHRAEERLRLGLAAGRMVAWEFDPATGMVSRSDNAEAIFGPGLTPADFTDRIAPEDQAQDQALIAAALAGETDGYEHEYRYRHPDGRWLWLYNVGRTQRDAQGRPIRLHGICLDITGRKRAEIDLRELNDTLEEKVAARTAELLKAEEALRQVQKMEALGQLTGGVAHDFNNLLGAVIGNLDLIRHRPDDAKRVLRLAEAGLQAAQRGAKLTGQLLAFSRSQRLELKPVLAGALVAGMRDLLERTLGPLVRLELDHDVAQPAVLADPTQLELAVLNLAINGRDAMKGEGTIRIATSALRLAGDPELADGDYVAISVSDSGTGMPPEIVARAFEPFFTTKERGKGTGLGLAQVYGIARQAGGSARIESHPGAGCTVTILLPRTDAPLPVAPADAAAPGASAGAAMRLLVIDDDDDVRAMLCDAAATLGYDVAAAADGREGLDLLDRFVPDLLVVDFAMPGMNGASVAATARARRPDLPLLFCTGYADTSAIASLGERRVATLNKPFTVAELHAALAAVMREG